MPFITPPETPTEKYCRRLSIPDSPFWVGTVTGLLYDLTLPYNWEQVDGISVTDAVASAQEMFNEYLESGGSCLPLAPYWDEETGDDADGDDLSSGFPWYENLADWAVTAFLAASFTPDAAIQYITTIRKVRLWFRTRDYGAIVRVLVDGIELGTVDTYSPEPGLVEFAYDIPEPVGFTAFADPTGIIRIEHTGTANSEAIPTDQGFAVEVIRKRLDWEEGGGGGCLRQYRLSETGANQYTDDGGATWEDASELPDYPEPAPREEPTDDEKICLAARNAVEVLRLTFVESITAWEASGDILDNIVATSGFLATVVGLFIAATWVSVWGFALFVAGNVLKGFDLITSSSWTEDDTQRLTCRLIEVATLQPDNTVTFDYEALIADSKGLFSNLAVAAFYSLAMDTIGQGGLNAAGGTDAITTFDCNTCDTWTIDLDMQYYWGESYARDSIRTCPPTGDATLAPGTLVFDAVDDRYEWQSAINIPGDNAPRINREFLLYVPTNATFTDIWWYYEKDPGGNWALSFELNNFKYCATNFQLPSPVHPFTGTEGGSGKWLRIRMGYNSSVVNDPRSFWFTGVRLSGTGVKPPWVSI